MPQGNLVNLTVLSNGDLEIVVATDRIDWVRLLEETPENALAILMEDIRCNSEWDIINPEDVGAWTSSTIISDGVSYPDSGSRVVWGRCWWFPQYAVENEIETLRTEGRVVFRWSGDPAAVPCDCELCQCQGCATCNQTGMILFQFARELPPCARDMKCLCAGHARGNPSTDPCDTREKP